MRWKCGVVWPLTAVLGIVVTTPHPASAFLVVSLVTPRQHAPFRATSIGSQRGGFHRHGVSGVDRGAHFLFRNSAVPPLLHIGSCIPGSRGEARPATGVTMSNRGAHAEAWAFRDAVFSFIAWAATTTFRLGRAFLGLMLRLFSARPFDHRPVSGRRRGKLVSKFLLAVTRRLARLPPAPAPAP